ncbi:MAG: hypothetical protein AAGB48_07750 [Planctomycetota bacterium]
MRRDRAIVAWIIGFPILTHILIVMLTRGIEGWEYREDPSQHPAIAHLFFVLAHLVGVVAWIGVIVLTVMGRLPGTRKDL